LGNPVELMLTAGQAHDLTCAEQLIDSADPGALLGDKAWVATSSELSGASRRAPPYERKSVDSQ
jgi:hypothetical protein